MMSCVLIKFAIKFVIIDIKHAHYQQNLNKCFNHSNTLVVWIEICSPNARLICVQAVWKCVCIMAHISSIRIIMIITFVTLYRLLTSIIFKFSSWEEKNMFIHHLKWSYLSFSLREHLKYKHFFLLHWTFLRKLVPNFVYRLKKHSECDIEYISGYVCGPDYDNAI